MARQAAIAAYKAAVAAAKAIAAAIKAIGDYRYLLDRPYRGILFRNLLLFGRYWLYADHAAGRPGDQPGLSEQA